VSLVSSVASDCIHPVNSAQGLVFPLGFLIFICCALFGEEVAKVCQSAHHFASACSQHMSLTSVEGNQPSCPVVKVFVHAGQVVDHSMQVVLEPLLICIVGGFVCVNYRSWSIVDTISELLLAFTVFERSS
jgi:hypothetical protein